MEMAGYDSAGRMADGAKAAAGDVAFLAMFKGAGTDLAAFPARQNRYRFIGDYDSVQQTGASPTTHPEGPRSTEHCLTIC